jgi:thymidylate synthase
MKNYLELLSQVLIDGHMTINRTNVSTIRKVGSTLRFNLQDGFPILTSRRVSFKICFEETMMFLRGETQTKILEEKGINIWKDNTSKAFQASRGLDYLQEGDMGKGYGHQIRNFGSTNHDQLAQLLDQLRDDPYSRRHVISHWCPNEVSSTVLPPCHIMHMYSIRDNYLDSSFIMRSSDLYHGLPYNIMSYAFINNIIAKYIGKQPGELIYFGHDCHIYSTHVDVVQKLLTREPKQLPTLVINKDLNTIQDILTLEWKDVKLVNYDPHSQIQKVDMVV